MIVIRYSMPGIMKETCSFQKQYLFIGTSFTPADQFNFGYNINSMLNIMIKKIIRQFLFKLVKNNFLYISKLDKSEFNPE